MAVIEWLPLAKVVVAKVATPLPLMATPEARVVAPSLKVMVPEPTFVGVTVAVKVTLAPGAETDCEEETVVDVLVSVPATGAKATPRKTSFVGDVARAGAYPGS